MIEMCDPTNMKIPTLKECTEMCDPTNMDDNDISGSGISYTTTTNKDECSYFGTTDEEYDHLSTSPSRTTIASNSNSISNTISDSIPSSSMPHHHTHIHIHTHTHSHLHSDLTSEEQESVESSTSSLSLSPRRPNVVRRKRSYTPRRSSTTTTTSSTCCSSDPNVSTMNENSNTHSVLNDIIPESPETATSTDTTFTHHRARHGRNNKSERSTNGIMLVRSLSESLDNSKNNNKIVLLRKMRRRHRRLLKHTKKIHYATDSTADDDDEISSYSSATSIYSSSSTLQTLHSKDIHDLSSSLNVTFTQVSIREYAIRPGDNPSVSQGVPLTLDWSHQQEYTQPLDLYESYRENNRRDRLQMIIPHDIRKSMLIEHGHTLRHIQDAIKDANKLRMARNATITSLAVGGLHGYSIHEKLQKKFRKFKKLFQSKDVKNKEKEILKFIQDHA